jgi:outer membrane lipopolysaccharide assembly protein LptE/RlpB
MNCVYSVIYSVHSGSGATLMESLEVPVRRYLTYSDAELYGKSAEEDLLMKDMRNDIAQQIVRRVALYKPTPQQLSSQPAAR